MNTGRTHFKKGFTPWNKGKKMPPEHRKKLSEARFRFYANGGKHPMQGKERLDMLGKKNPNAGKFGKEHPKWKELKKRPFYASIRQLFKYRQWRSDIFTRDNYTCVLCGKSGYIEADHYPIRFIDIIRKHEIKMLEQALDCEELWSINNGRTLCRPCHLKTITWGRRSSN